MREQEVGLGLMPLVLSEQLDDDAQQGVDYERHDGHDDCQDWSPGVVGRVCVLLNLELDLGKHEGGRKCAGEDHQQYEVRGHDILPPG